MNYVFGGVKEGETVVVSAASGGVGSIAVQLAKKGGAKVVGIAGGEKKCAFLKEEVGVDVAIDYKLQGKTIGEQLDEVIPEGVDFFFDNVGGEILDEVLKRIKMGGRIVICGAASQYGGVNKGKVVGPSNYLKLAERSGRMGGFVVLHHADKFPEAITELKKMKEKGEIKSVCYVEEGEVGEGFLGLLMKMWGGKAPSGKLVLKVKE